MPKFKVIKAHDGVEVGTEKCLPISYITRYMVENGYWAEVKEAEKATKSKKK